MKVTKEQVSTVLSIISKGVSTIRRFIKTL